MYQSGNLQLRWRCNTSIVFQECPERDDQSFLKNGLACFLGFLIFVLRGYGLELLFRVVLHSRRNGPLDLLSRHPTLHH